VRGLLHLARTRVQEQSGIELRHEVKFVGEF
jgi:UDP-N-acetylenolpyruvoylglucosamine reductase